MKHIPPVGDTIAAQPPRRRRLAVFVALTMLILAVPQASGGLEHVVTPGETLGTIAPQYDSSVDAIADVNAIADVHRIFTGQVLTIPSGNAPSGSATAGPESHTIAAGETLSVVAEHYGTTVADLSARNGITDPDFLRAGTVLSLRDTVPAAPANHIVVAGDTLAVIAAEYGTTVEQLVAANGLSDPNFVREGATLVIGPASAPTSPPASTPAEPVVTTHAVREGETLAGIAATYSTTVNALTDTNGITDPNLVTIGRVLTIPAASAPPASRQTTVGTTAAPFLDQWARVYGVPVDLLKSLTWFESGWSNDVLSEVGAIGIGQLMPDTVDFVSTHLLGEPVDPHDLSDNIRASARFLRYLLDETNWDSTRALAAYYQGLAALRRDGIYASSWFYIDGILSLRERF